MYHLKQNLSKYVIFIIVFFALYVDGNLRLWTMKERVIEYDVRTYYGYLPATFIYHDLKLENPDKFKYGENLYWIWSTPTDNGPIFKMTMGLSYLYLPFFASGHLIASLSGYETNGFSEPYKIMLLIGGLVYYFLGLYYVRKLLKQYFNETIVSIVLVLIGLGTNLLFYSTINATMSHVYNFALFAMFIYYTRNWHNNPSLKNASLIGLLFGLISLIRPSNAAIAIVFVLYNISSTRQLKERASLFLNNYKSILLITIISAIIWIPQFLYWKYITGSYLFYSYKDESFFFSNPHIIKGLFSFQKGWLIYTPIMAFALLGFVFMKGNVKNLRPFLIIFITLMIYITFSWWCWWYGGTFGQRSMIDFYALLAIPLASFVQYILSKKLIIKVIFAFLALFFTWLNVFQSYQFEYLSLHHDAMTKTLYFKQFGKIKKIDNFEKYLVYPDYEKAKKGE